MLRTFFLSAFLALSSISFALKPLVLTDSLKEVWVSGHHVSIYEDMSSSLTLEEVKNKPFRDEGIDNPINEHIEAAYWLKFLLVDKRTKSVPALIEIFDFDLDEVWYYQQDKEGKYQEKKAGYAYPFHQRHLNHKNVSFHIEPVYDGSAYIYMRFKSKRHNILEPVIRTYATGVNYGLKEYLFFGIFYGLLLLMIFYNLLYYIILKTKDSIYYVYYASLVLVYIMSENGTGFQFLWPNHPELNPYVGTAVLVLSEIALLLFTQSFLGLNEKDVKLKRLTIILLVVRVFTGIPQVFFHFTQWWLILDVIYIQLILLIGVKAFRKGFSAAKWFVVAFCALDVSFLITYLERISLLPSSVYTVYALYGGIVLQFVFLCIAVAESVKHVFLRKNAIQKELINQYKLNESLSEKVNKELEEKVRQRTVALTEAQEELKAKAEEITKMNLALDLANRKLEKDFSSVVKESTQRGRFTLEEFKRAFPDDLTCKKFIYELKKAHPFLCKKCKSEKEIKGKSQFDRRCAKCNYNESITANTIFHRTRYPLYKGFYMLYYFMSIDESRLSLTTLSKELDVHQSSLQLFKNKVYERLKKKSKQQSVSWEEMILNS